LLAWVDLVHKMQSEIQIDPVIVGIGGCDGFGQSDVDE
jgi:hypothetical protein